MNIFQEALISVWFLTKLSIFGLTLVGAKVMWDKYGHHALSLKDGLIREDEEDEDSLSRWYG